MNNASRGESLLLGVGVVIGLIVSVLMAYSENQSLRYIVTALAGFALIVLVFDNVRALIFKGWKRQDRSRDEKKKIREQFDEHILQDLGCWHKYSDKKT